MMDFDGNSWRDRCNRYFSSLSDTEKDRDQEKHEKLEHNNDEKTRKHSINSNREENLDKEWKDLGDIRNKVQRGGKFCRYTRSMFSVLDVHGGRLAGKSRSLPETAFWILITILAIAGTFVLIYFTVREYRLSAAVYTITEFSNLKNNLYEANEAALTFCNHNLFRRDRIGSTRFSYLLNLDNGVANMYDSGTITSIKNVVLSNTKLLETIIKNTHTDVESVVNELTEDLEVREMMVSSNVFVEDRLSRLGLWDIVRQRIRPTLSEIKAMGHQTDDMIVSCRVGLRNCSKSEIKKHADISLGNCFTIQPEQTGEKVEIILNAQPEQYLQSVTPSVGFWVSVRHVRSAIDAGSRIYAEPNRLTHIQLEKITVTERETPCTDEAESDECMAKCYEDHLNNLCGCKEISNTTEDMCDPAKFKQYICTKSVKVILKRTQLSCKCGHSCKDVTFNNIASSMPWPSQYNMKRIREYLTQNGIPMNETQIQSSLLKVIVKMDLKTHERRDQRHTKNIFELLAQLGGLSALVAGISVITILETIWIMIKVGIDFVRYLCKRSQDNGSLQRLTDSEITSITWAIYRQKRHMEEINKDKEKHQRKSQTTIEGNVPNRLNRRNGNGSKVHEDQFECRNIYASEENIGRHFDRQKVSQPNNDRNGYRRYYQLKAISEEKQDDGNEKQRPYSEPHTNSNQAYPGYGNQNGLLGSSDYGYRQRPRAHASSLPYIQPTEPPEGVRLYGGQSAYFYNSTSPTYL